MRAILIAILSLFVLESFSQSRAELKKIYEDIESKRKEYWKKKQYDKAAEELQKFVKVFDSYKGEPIVRLNYVAMNVFYNQACAYSLIEERNKAINALNRAVKLGYKEYYHVLKDSDLDNIRDMSEFNDVLKTLKERGDYKYILKKYPSYSKKINDIPSYRYQNASELSSLRKKYNLDSVAGNGTEVSKIINLMKWVHNTVRHSGNSMNPKDKTADGLIQICKKENRGINCRMMSTILNEAYLSMGFKSKFVTCMPKGKRFADCHVINSVYSTELKKWLWMDASFEAYVMDGEGNLLSIREVRERLINNKPVKVNKEMNWNGKPYYGGEKRYLHEYMSKNLYRFSIPVNSVSALEAGDTKRSYNNLYPLGYEDGEVKTKRIMSGKIYENFYTNNADEFWN